MSAFTYAISSVPKRFYSILEICNLKTLIKFGSNFIKYTVIFEFFTKYEYTFLKIGEQISSYSVFRPLQLVNLYNLKSNLPDKWSLLETRK
jgi:hypothetical protein